MKQILFQVLLALIAIVTPEIFQWVVGNFPNAPISESGILDWLVYLLSFAFFGTRIKKIENLFDFQKGHVSLKVVKRVW